MIGRWRIVQTEQWDQDHATRDPQASPERGQGVGNCSFLARLSALAAGSHSRGSRGQAGCTGGGAAFAGGFGASKVADLSRRQNSFLLLR